MPKIKANADGQITLPESFLKLRNLTPEGEYWLDERDGDLVLHYCLPDARKLYIEATTACNLDCHTCIRHSWTDPNAHMSRETFQRILDGLDAFPKLERVVFTSFGEPLVHPRLLEMIAALRERGLGVTLGTNGLLLTEKVLRELIRLGVDQLVVSIDGVNPETYADIRGVQQRMIIENIDLLNRLKQELKVNHPVLGIEFVALRSNVTEVEQLPELASRLNAARTVVSHVLPYTAEMNEQKLYGYEPKPPLRTSGWPVRSDAWVRWGIMELPRMHWGGEPRCRFVNDYAIVIDWDGEVSPCYALSHSYRYFALDGIEKQVERHTFGNIHHQSLSDIWTSEDYVRFRSEVRAFHFPSCPDCELRETCDLRKTNEGCWGFNPSCADCLWAQDIVRCP